MHRARDVLGGLSEAITHGRGAGPVYTWVIHRIRNTSVVDPASIGMSSPGT